MELHPWTRRTSSLLQWDLVTTRIGIRRYVIHFPIFFVGCGIGWPIILMGSTDHWRVGCWWSTLAIMQTINKLFNSPSAWLTRTVRNFYSSSWTVYPVYSWVTHTCAWSYLYWRNAEFRTYPRFLLFVECKLVWGKACKLSLSDTLPWEGIFFM